MPGDTVWLFYILAQQHGSWFTGLIQWSLEVYWVSPLSYCPWCGVAVCLALPPSLDLSYWRCPLVSTLCRPLLRDFWAWTFPTHCCKSCIFCWLCVCVCVCLYLSTCVYMYWSNESVVVFHTGMWLFPCAVLLRKHIELAVKEGNMAVGGVMFGAYFIPIMALC